MEIYKKVYGKEISKEKALEKALALLHFMKAILKEEGNIERAVE